MVANPRPGENPLTYAFRAMGEIAAEYTHPNLLKHSCGWNVRYIDEKETEAKRLYSEHVKECKRK